MLSKAQRLSRADFDTVFKTGRRVHSPTLTLIYAQSSTFHASVVVGKKVAKRAVARNQLRRRLYGILYRLCREGVQSGTYILIAKPQITNVTRKALPAEVAELVGRIRK